MCITRSPNFDRPDLAVFEAVEPSKQTTRSICSSQGPRGIFHFVSRCEAEKNLQFVAFPRRPGGATKKRFARLGVTETLGESVLSALSYLRMRGRFAAAALAPEIDFQTDPALARICAHCVVPRDASFVRARTAAVTRARCVGRAGAAGRRLPRGPLFRANKEGRCGQIRAALLCRRPNTSPEPAGWRSSQSIYRSGLSNSFRAELAQSCFTAAAAASRR